MKKYLIAAAVLVIALAIAPLAIGKLAERRMNAGLDLMVKEVPYLSIVERNYHTGWFASEMDVTLAFFSGLGAPDNLAPRIVMHNTILHGPILGSGIGLARVSTRFESPRSTPLEHRKSFGGDDRFNITTTIGFAGGARTVVSGEAYEFQSAKESKSWDALKLVIETSSNGDSFSIDGKWPRASGRDEDGASYAFRNLVVMGSGKRIAGDVFDTDLEMMVDEFKMTEGEDSVRVEKLRYAGSTEPKGEFVDLGIKVGCGRIESKNLNLVEAHYDFTMRHVHVATWDKFMTAVKASSAEPSTAYQKMGLELLEHEPEFAIERISFSTEEGTGTLKGVVRLKGVTAADLEAGAMALIARVVADLDLDVSEAMLAKLSGNTQAADGMVKEGFAERREGHLVSKIVFQDGKLLINGKEQALPGVGGPAPQPAMPE